MQLPPSDRSAAPVTGPLDHQEGTVDSEARWHNPQEVVKMGSHLKDILDAVPSTLKPL